MITDKEEFKMSLDIVTNSILSTIERLDDLGMKQCAAFGMVCGVSARLWTDMQNMPEGEMEIARKMYEFMQSNAVSKESEG